MEGRGSDGDRWCGCQWFVEIGGVGLVHHASFANRIFVSLRVDHDFGYFCAVELFFNMANGCRMVQPIPQIRGY